MSPGPGGRFAAFRRRDGAEATPRSLAPDPEAAGAPPALIVGLGNPGDRYAGTRHNVGWWCLDVIAQRHGVTLRHEQRVDAASIVLQGVRVHLARPRSYMNESGGPVAAELRRLGLTRDRLLVVYDEIDLPLGTLRMRPHGGHGGHNGMRSIIAATGGSEFPRMRIGIDRPHDDDGHPIRDPERVAAWVLGRPPAAERRALEEAVGRAADAALLAATEGVEHAMRRIHGDH